MIFDVNPAQAQEKIDGLQYVLLSKAPSLERVAKAVKSCFGTQIFLIPDC